MLRKTQRVRGSIGASRTSENENERGKLRTHKIEGGDCGVVGWGGERSVECDQNHSAEEWIAGI